MGTGAASGRSKPAVYQSRLRNVPASTLVLSTRSYGHYSGLDLKKSGQIIISEQTLQDAGSIVKIQGQRQVKPKGVQQPITIYEVYGIAGFYNLYLPREEELFLPLDEEIPIQYALLDGKNISDTLFKGSLVELSDKGAKVRSENLGEDNLPSALTNLKLNLLTSNIPAEVSEDMYAKVLQKWAERGSFYIRFTANPPAVQMRLDELYNRFRQ